MTDYNKKWRQRNPEKVRAHWVVSNAIRYGKLIRLPCQECGNKKSHAHHNDYSQPLLIEWLCHKCHWKRHGWIAREKTKSDLPRTAWNVKKNTLSVLAMEYRNKGLSYSQIGQILNVSKGTVFKWINDPPYQ